VTFEHCSACCGEGLYGHDCGEDSCACLDPDDNVVCSICRGEGGFHFCISSEQWCREHPMRGRENVEPNTVEWFCMRETEVADG